MNYVTSSEQMFRTTDYDGFKRVIGNRRVLEERVTKILASIDKIGYIPIPLVVNEKMEVIDGQGRLEACKRRGLPVNFIIKPGLKIKDCITMNINVTPWNLMDFIMCYAEIGNESYQRIMKLYEDMTHKHGSKSISVNNLCSALFNTKKAPGNAIKSGRLSVDETRYQEAHDCLEFAFSIMDYIKDNKIRLKSNDMSDLLTSIIFCYKWKDIDNKKLYKVLTKDAHQMQKWSNVENCLEEIDFIYNYNSRNKTTPLKRLWEDLSLKENHISNFIPVDTTLDNYDLEGEEE